MARNIYNIPNSMRVDQATLTPETYFTTRQAAENFCERKRNDGVVAHWKLGTIGEKSIYTVYTDRRI